MSTELFESNQSSMEDSIHLIQKAINRGKRVISNINKISDLDKTEVVLEKLDVLIILNEIVQFILESNPTRKISIDIDSPDQEVLIKANRLISDVFDNLLNNAIKYNQVEIIKIIIIISKETKQGINYWKMEFKDNGMGITDAQKKIIFKRITNAYDKSKGMGIGLSLVKKIVDSYNGEIWVEDRINGDHLNGSNFILLIPEF